MSSRSASSPPPVLPSHPIIAQFAEDTSIHGIKDLVRIWRDSVYWKWVWLCLLVCSTGCMIYEMIQVGLNYLAHPTATQIEQMYLDSYNYPLMLFCPRKWINASRVKSIGLPKLTLTFALSFLELVKITSPPFIDIESASADLSRIMSKYNFQTYFDLYRNISDDSERTMACSSCAVWPLRKTMTENGVCYVIELKSQRLSFLLEHPPQITFNPSKIDTEAEDWLPTYTSIHRSDHFYVGYHINDFFSTDPIKMIHNRSYIIKVTPTLRRRSKGYELRTGRRCYDREAILKMNHSQRMCYSDCEEWTFGPVCWKCQYLGYSYDRPNQTRPPWFSSFTYVEPPEQETEECQKREKPKYDACTASCLPPCDEWIYDTAVITVNRRRVWTNRAEAAVTIVISYQVKSGTLSVEEIPTYTYHTFLSNIGGQLGLWLGASVLSIFQLIFFLIRVAYSKWKGKREVDNDIQMDSTKNGIHTNVRL